MEATWLKELKIVFKSFSARLYILQPVLFITVLLLTLATKHLSKFIGHLSITPVGHSTTSWNGATSKCTIHCNIMDDKIHGRKGANGQGHWTKTES